MVIVEAIPYKTFKEKIRIVKNHAQRGIRIIIYETYVYIERVESVL